MIAHCGPKKDRIIASSRAVSAQSFKISCLSGNDGLVYEDLSIDFGRRNFRQNRDMACKLGCGLFLNPQ